jgi:two-component system response regulator
MDAFRFLRRQGKYTRAAAPSMVILGAGFLDAGGDPLIIEIKGDAGHKFLPVIALVNPKRLSTTRALYDGGVNCVLRFPPDMEELFRILRSLVEYWFHLAELPTAPI